MYFGSKELMVSGLKIFRSYMAFLNIHIHIEGVGRCSPPVEAGERIRKYKEKKKERAHDRIGLKARPGDAAHWDSLGTRGRRPRRRIRPVQDRRTLPEPLPRSPGSRSRSSR